MSFATSTSSHPISAPTSTPERPLPQPALLVAAAGGHLTELHRLMPRLEAVDPATSRWVTFRSSQSSVMLAGSDVDYVRLTEPRDLVNVVRNLAPAWRILRAAKVDRVISTGSAVALSFIPLARMLGFHCDFVESAARSHGPSLTGRILSYIPGVRCYTQCADWANDRWVYRGSLFDGITPAPTQPPAGERINVVVTLGTMPHQFTSLLERLVPLLDDDPRFEVKWQLGSTRAARMPGDWHDRVPNDVLTGWMADADLVIAHAGLGSTLDALDQGRHPLLVPRARARDEHVDDHQLDMADVIGTRDIATVASVDELSMDLIERCVGKRVVRDAVAASAPFALEPVARA